MALAASLVGHQYPIFSRSKMIVEAAMFTTKEIGQMNRPTPHLVPAFGAINLLICFLIGYHLYATQMGNRYVHALVPRLPSQANMGAALQQTAFQNPDLLVVYGSSEMLDPISSYRAIEFFQSYPTGFMVMDTARAGVTSLNIVQSLAAIGPDLRGKKVVISFTPSMFESPGVGILAYSGNFSQLHAEELVFNPTLSLKLKQLIADRMLDYPTTLEQTPLLRFELGNLVHRSPLFLALYYAAWPLGELETTALQLQDHAAVLDYLGLHKNLPEPVRRASSIDWAQDVKAAQAEQMSLSVNNSYGVDTDHWSYYEEIFSHDPRPGSLDWKFINALHDSAEWTDFDLLLQVLKELGAKPLILSRPFNGPLLNAMGISTQALNHYYDKLEAAVTPYQFTLVDFRQYTQDPYFSSDQSSHTSRKGWVYVDQTLDAFYHGRMP